MELGQKQGMFAVSGCSVTGERLLSARGMRGRKNPGSIKTHYRVWSFKRIGNQTFSLTTQEKKGGCKTTQNNIMEVKMQPAD